MAKYFYDKYELAKDYQEKVVGTNNVLFMPYSFTYYFLVRPDVRNDGLFFPQNPNIVSSKAIAETHSFIGDYLVTNNKTKKHEIKKVELRNNDGVTFNTTVYEVDIKRIKGEFIEKVIAEDGTYPSDGIQGEYWYVKGELSNAPPVIIGQNTNLGDKNVGFTMSYQVDDVDTADSLTVTEKLNNKLIRTINNAPRKQNLTIEIDNETLFSFPLNSINTIEIKVDDGQGGIAEKIYTFKRTDVPLVISGIDESLGIKTESFSYLYSVSDSKGKIIKIIEKLNNEIVNSYDNPTQLNRKIDINIDNFQYWTTNKIEIIVTSSLGISATRTITFVRGLAEDTSLNEVAEKVSELIPFLNGKQGLIRDAITGVDDTVVIPTDPTFRDLANAIGQISTGKKWASGNTDSGSVAKIIVTGLDFQPSLIVVDDGGMRASYIQHAKDERINTIMYGGTVGAITVALKNPFVLSTDGFTVGLRANQNHSWIAFE